MSGLVDLSYAKNWEFDPEFSGQGDADRSRIAATEEWVVRERWFIGSLSFRVGEAIYEYGRTPLLDFSMSLRCALNLLAADGDSIFVAEGGSEVHLSLDGGNVESRRRGSGLVGVAEFVDLAKVQGDFKFPAGVSCR